MEKCPIREKRRGSILLEVVITIGILASLSGSVAIVIVSGVHANLYNKNSQLALDFAKEGIEKVGEIQAANWLKYPREKVTKWMAGSDEVEMQDGNYIPVFEAQAKYHSLLKVNAFLDLDDGVSPDEETLFRIKQIDLDNDGALDLNVNSTESIEDKTVFYRQLSLECTANDALGNCYIFRVSFQDELYLINAGGTKKTMLGRERINNIGEEDQYALSILQMDGLETNLDEQIDTWVCSDGYICTSDNPVLDPEGEVYDVLEKYPYKEDLDDFKAGYEERYDDFVPISPPQSTITDLKFFVVPTEDPRKAFAEKSESIQLQPYVTIILTLSPASFEREGYFGDIPEVTLQTTAFSEVFNEVNSF